MNGSVLPGSADSGARGYCLTPLLLAPLVAALQCVLIFLLGAPLLVTLAAPYLVLLHSIAAAWIELRWDSVAGVTWRLRDRRYYAFMFGLPTAYLIALWIVPRVAVGAWIAGCCISLVRALAGGMAKARWPDPNPPWYGVIHLALTVTLFPWPFILTSIVRVSCRSFSPGDGLDRRK